MAIGGVLAGHDFHLAETGVLVAVAAFFTGRTVVLDGGHVWWVRKDDAA